MLREGAPGMGVGAGYSRHQHAPPHRLQGALKEVPLQGSHRHAELRLSVFPGPEFGPLAAGMEAVRREEDPQRKAVAPPKDQPREVLAGALRYGRDCLDCPLPKGAAGDGAEPVDGAGESPGRAMAPAGAASQPGVLLPARPVDGGLQRSQHLQLLGGLPQCLLDAHSRNEWLCQRRCALPPGGFPTEGCRGVAALRCARRASPVATRISGLARSSAAAPPVASRSRLVVGSPSAPAALLVGPTGRERWTGERIGGISCRCHIKWAGGLRGRGEAVEAAGALTILERVAAVGERLLLLRVAKGVVGFRVLRKGGVEGGGGPPCKGLCKEVVPFRVAAAARAAGGGIKGVVGGSGAAAPGGGPPSTAAAVQEGVAARRRCLRGGVGGLAGAVPLPLVDGHRQLLHSRPTLHLGGNPFDGAIKGGGPCRLHGSSGSRIRRPQPTPPPGVLPA
mmetsp:Transcript_11161/g.31647  ORF Transcript_11161/g.31647 Transcript_11161/m.31647 type:complete len:450 (-) Transcript_11161:1644-2993(-)